MTVFISICRQNIFFLFQVNTINICILLHIEGEADFSALYYYKVLKSVSFQNKMTLWKGHIVLDILKYKIASVDHEKDYKLHF